MERIKWTTAITNNGDTGDKRDIFDNHLRSYCTAHNKAVFDLAAIESHDLEDNLTLDDLNNEAMYAAYADDGQDPNRLGRTRLAEAMWWLLASGRSVNRVQQGWEGVISMEWLALSDPLSLEAVRTTL